MEKALDRKISLRVYFVLIGSLALLAGISLFLPQGEMGLSLPQAPLPAPLPLLALANAGIIMVIYGGLGLIGVMLARKLGLPEIWDHTLSNRRRFVLPALAGAGLGIVLVVADVIMAPINGIGRFPHPPFPTSFVASISAAIGEEVIFRLFFISFWTWLVSRVILRGHGQGALYWVVSGFSAIAFGLGHLPALMFIHGWIDLAQIPPVVLGEVIVLNGMIAVAAAYAFKKVGFIGPVGVHLWTDVVWHVLWGAFR